LWEIKKYKHAAYTKGIITAPTCMDTHKHTNGYDTLERKQVKDIKEISLFHSGSERTILWVWEQQKQKMIRRR